MKDTHLLGNDVLCITETQFQVDKDTSYIESSLQGRFNENKYRRLHFVIQNTISLLT